MRILLYLVIYLSAVVFVIACIFRALHFSRTPLHVRWELYPVPHEDPKRAAYGGSYFESLNWWDQSSHFGLWGELKFMAIEIFFLKSLWEHNRRMWFRSFFFHFGLYLLVLTTGLIVLAAGLAIFAPGLTGSPAGTGLQLLYMITGAIGLTIGILGALGLLVLRLTDSDLKNYTTRSDIFNLLFFIVTFSLLAAGCLSRDASGSPLLAFCIGLFRFDAGVEIPGLLTAGLFSAGILIAYIPMTHMSHFIAKYFTYHSVRWDDEPNRREGKLEAKVAECLSYKPTWAARHFMADGTKTWAEIAEINPALEDKK